MPIVICTSASLGKRPSLGLGSRRNFQSFIKEFTRERNDLEAVEAVFTSIPNQAVLGREKPADT
ncbi:hypothetical protein N7451_007896 [Penicillium sp. IBT 35674x]|nr:hypothetical protein N7451_007896 [Penicillium sp. IBT 35674x]